MKTTTGASSARQPVWQDLVLAGTGLLTVLWVLSQMGASLDLSDEGYYLNSALYPHLYTQSFTLFGFLYAPLGNLAGWDLATYRCLGLLITSSLTISLVFRIGLWIGLGRLRSILLGFAASAWPLVLFYLWLPTPNYNSLAFQGLLVIAIGLVPPNGGGARSSLWQSALIGTGGWLAFMGKPTTALIAGIVVFVFLVATQSRKIHAIAIPAAVAAILLLTTAYSLDGGIVAFIARLHGSVAHAALLDAGHSGDSLLRLDTLALTVVEWVALLASGVLVAALTTSKSPLLNPLWLTLGSVTVVALVLGLNPWWVAHTSSLPLVILGLPIGAALGVMADKGLQDFWSTLRPVLPLSATLAMFPYALAFGTNNNNWFQSALGCAFWLFAALPLVGRFSLGGPRYAGAMVPLLAAGQLMVAVFLSVSMNHPYRQMEPLRDQDQITHIGPGHTPIAMSVDTALYLDTLQQIATAAGLASQDPVIDLTGRMPGALFALDATAIGDAWIVGGYPGSAVMARSALSTVSCDILARAWVLSEPAGPRALALSEVLPPAFTFVDVGSVESPLGDYLTHFTQTLLRPEGDLADRQIACEQWRARASARPSL